MIKVMTFNIRMGFADDGENHWEKRKALLVERIRAFEPDLLGLQECADEIQAPYLRAALPDYRFLGVRRGGPGGNPALEISAILYKRDVFDEICHRTFWLSETPDTPETLSWGAAFCRTVEQVTLSARQRPRPFTYFNTHFDYAGDAPLESARLLRSRVDALGTEVPVLLSGDFNALKDTPPYQALVYGIQPETPMLKDVYRQVQPWPSEEESTFHGFGREVEPASIDWILASAHFEVRDAGIDRFHQGSLYPSDHYPLWAVVELSS